MNSFRLFANLRFRFVEGVAIGADAQDRDDDRSITFYFGGEPAPTRDEIVSGEFRRRSGGERDDVADANAALQQLALVERRNLAAGESGLVQRRPESISR